MTEHVLFSVSENGVASITLNRPKALNSLSYDMLQPIGQKLKEWENDERIALIVLGAGTKGFVQVAILKLFMKHVQMKLHCSMRNVSLKKSMKLIHIFINIKPIIACLDGIVMGGGVGLTNGAKYRIVTERTKWAMPEMNIGFFPDVGAAYFLNKAPGYAGRYVALTASILKASDVLFINAADYFMASDSLPNFLTELESVNWHKEDDVHTHLKEVIRTFATAPTLESELAPSLEEINSHFAFDTIEEIIHSLEKDQSSFALKAKETLLSKSPISLKVTLKQFIDGQDKSVEECFATDLVLAKTS